MTYRTLLADGDSCRDRNDSGWNGGVPPEQFGGDHDPRHAGLSGRREERRQSARGQERGRHVQRPSQRCAHCRADDEQRDHLAADEAGAQRADRERELQHRHPPRHVGPADGVADQWQRQAQVVATDQRGEPDGGQAADERAKWRPGDVGGDAVAEVIAAPHVQPGGEPDQDPGHHQFERQRQRPIGAHRVEVVDASVEQPVDDSVSDHGCDSTCNQWLQASAFGELDSKQDAGDRSTDDGAEPAGNRRHQQHLALVVAQLQQAVRPYR